MIIEGREGPPWRRDGEWAEVVEIHQHNAQVQWDKLALGQKLALLRGIRIADKQRTYLAMQGWNIDENIQRWSSLPFESLNASVRAELMRILDEDGQFPGKYFAGIRIDRSNSDNE